MVIDDIDEEDKKLNRRRFLNWASAVGLAAAFPATVAEIAEAQAKRSVPDPVPPSKRGDPSQPIEHIHPTEIPEVQEQIGRAKNDPTELIDSTLRQHIQENPSGEPIDIKVRTVGRRVITSSEGTYKRTIRGWQPHPSEVGRLRRFGDIEFVPEFISTRIELGNVDPDDLERIASLEFVLGISWNPPVELDRLPAGTEGIPKEDLYSNSYFWFDGISGTYDINRNIRIGIVDTGYVGGGASDFTESYAERSPHGIDESLADAFNSAWDEDDGDYHGDNVTDVAAYLLDDGHDDLFVPMKMFGSSGTVRSTGEAIEFAERYEIDVLNLSFGGATSSTNCPSVYCDELGSYTSAGYIPIASSGNLDADGTVTFPGGEWLTIGAGGIDTESCSNGSYSAASGSNYGTIRYNGCVYCSFFSPQNVNRGFVPRIYASYETATDTSETLRGTSYASPAVAAVAAIMQSNGLYNYDTAEEIFQEMQWSQVCPDDEAEGGQLLDAWDAYYRTR